MERKESGNQSNEFVRVSDTRNVALESSELRIVLSADAAELRANIYRKDETEQYGLESLGWVHVKRRKDAINILHTALKELAMMDMQEPSERGKEGR